MAAQSQQVIYVIPSNWRDQQSNLDVLACKPVFLLIYHLEVHFSELHVPWTSVLWLLLQSVSTSTSAPKKIHIFLGRRNTDLYSMMWPSRVLSWGNQAFWNTAFCLFSAEAYKTIILNLSCILEPPWEFLKLSVPKLYPGLIKSESLGVAQASVFLKLSCDPNVQPLWSLVRFWDEERDDLWTFIEHFALECH